jgi:hypothetical protein
VAEADDTEPFPGADNAGRHEFAKHVGATKLQDPLDKHTVALLWLLVYPALQP